MMLKFLSISIIAFLIQGCGLQQTKEERNFKNREYVAPKELLIESKKSKSIEINGIKLGMSASELEEKILSGKGRIYKGSNLIDYYKNIFSYTSSWEREQSEREHYTGFASSIQVDYEIPYYKDLDGYQPSIMFVDLCRGRVNKISFESAGPKTDQEGFKQQFKIDTKFPALMKVSDKPTGTHSLVYGTYESHQHALAPTYRLSYRNNKYCSCREEEYSNFVNCYEWWSDEVGDWVYYNIWIKGVMLSNDVA